MGIHSIHKRAAQLMCGLLLACIVNTVAAQQLVNSDANGAAVPTEASTLNVLDISANGRYVLFSNYSPTGEPALGSVLTDCRVYRKDRQTGELLTVFESDPNGFRFCGRAKLSADGNRVAAAPEGPSGPCVRVVLPDGNPGFDCGEVTALLVRDLDTGTDQQVISRRIIATNRDFILIGAPRYPGAELHSLSADAEVAVLKNLDVINGAIADVFSVADVRTNTLEKVVVQKAADADYLNLSSVAVSPDGLQLAVRAKTGTFVPCAPDALFCNPPQDVDGDGQFDSFPLNCFFYPSCKDLSIHRIYIIDRLTGTQSLPAALDNLPAGATLGANAWSANANLLHWIELPKLPAFAQCTLPGCLPVESCSGPDCELTVRRYNFSSGKIRTRKTSFDPETLSLCTSYGPGDPQVTRLNCTPQLSRDGNKLLFGRAVKHPFGGDWQANPGAPAFVCVSKASLDSPDVAPEFIECPSSYYPPFFPYPQNPLPLRAVSFSAPVNWYLQNLVTGHTTLVSITDAGQLFQSDGVVLADNGKAAVFRSRDPRLNNLVPGVTQYDESRLAEGCFWSPAGSGSKLLVATNDNTLIGADNDFYVSPETPDFYVYPTTPVFCLVSHPALSANLFALDIGRGVNLAGITFGGFGSGAVPMQTWIANPGRARATMVGVDITISGRGTGGRVGVANDTPCEVYPAAVETNDNSVLLRCELPALAPLEFWQLRWSISSDKPALVKIDTTISSNERETQPSNNAHISYAAAWPRSLLFNWFGGVR